MRRSRLAVLAALILASLVASANAIAATAVSTNWSGYAATGDSFSSVTGTWTVAETDCSETAGTGSASAFWVGLGGNSQSSNALEQAGTEADCSATGAVRYAAWFELLPAASVKLPLAVSPGDRVRTTVSVAGTAVTLKVENLTTGKTALRVKTMASPDLSSAEWIAEAPSSVTQQGAQVLPLADFGTVAFSDASATTTAGHTGSISDSAWKATRIALESSSGGQGGPGGPYGRFAAYTTGAEAIPTILSASGSSFSVRWKSAATTNAPAPPDGAI